jgi:membrane protein DedA with SNARE-associated domain
MGHAIFDTLRTFVADYGYWAVAIALLCENAGLPVPGETTLLLASFLAHSEQKLHLGWIIVVGSIAATLGDNLGYVLGHFGGRPLLERYRKVLRISDVAIARGEKLFERYGSEGIFFARFIFGLRIVAGPLAGVLRMHWKKFAVFNALGAVLWVSVIATVGYLFGRHWRTLEGVIRRFDLAILVVAVIALLVWWRRRRRENYK